MNKFILCLVIINAFSVFVLCNYNKNNYVNTESSSQFKKNIYNGSLDKGNTFIVNNIKASPFVRIAVSAACQVVFGTNGALAIQIPYNNYDKCNSYTGKCMEPILINYKTDPYYQTKVYFSKMTDNTKTYSDRIQVQIPCTLNGYINFNNAIMADFNMGDYQAFNISFTSGTSMINYEVTIDLTYYL